MNSGHRLQPIVRLVPQEPLTNSRLMIYCSTSDKIPINFHATWSRVNPQNGYRQQIKNHEGSCYQCSPLDFNYCIEVTIYYQQKPGLRTSKIANFPPVKLYRDLQQRQLYVMQPVACRMQIEDIILDVTTIVKHQSINILSSGSKLQLNMGDFVIDIKYNCMAFTLIIENRYQDLLSFLSHVTGKAPKFRTKACEFVFYSRIDRDLILLLTAQDNRKNSRSSIKSGTSQRAPQNDNNLSDISINRGARDKSLSITKRKDNNKIKISQRIQKKVPHQTTHSRQQECLNIYEEEFLPPKKQSNTNSKTDLGSMDLRNSFAELEHNHTPKEDERMSSNSYRNVGSSKKLEEQNSSLKDENRKLRLQIEGMSSLAKENATLKKRYHQLSEQINRLQFQRKEILQDKLKFQASFHRQAQQKQYFKKQVQHYRQLMASHNIDKRDASMSPFGKQNHQRPVTPDRSRVRNDCRGGIITRGPRQ